MSRMLYKYFIYIFSTLINKAVILTVYLYLFNPGYSYCLLLYTVIPESRGQRLLKRQLNSTKGRFNTIVIHTNLR